MIGFFRKIHFYRFRRQNFCSYQRRDVKMSDFLLYRNKFDKKFCHLRDYVYRAQKKHEKFSSKMRISHGDSHHRVMVHDLWKIIGVKNEKLENSICFHFYINVIANTIIQCVFIRTIFYLCISDNINMYV